MCGLRASRASAWRHKQKRYRIGDWSCPGLVEGEGLSAKSWTVTRLAVRFAPARGGAADRPGEAPPLPVRRAARGMAQPGSSDLDAEDLPGMGDDEIADPLGQRGSTLRYGVLGLKRLVQRAPLDV
jgi:hypothetical protein